MESRLKIYLHHESDTDSQYVAWSPQLSIKTEQQIVSNWLNISNPSIDRSVITINEYPLCTVTYETKNLGISIIIITMILLIIFLIILVNTDIVSSSIITSLITNLITNINTNIISNMATNIISTIILLILYYR